MSASTAAMASPTSVDTARTFWERFWRTGGIQFAALSIIVYAIYGNQPQVGAPADALTAFYVGNRTRILLAVFFASLNLLNLLWFVAALRTTLADMGQDGWGAAATTSSSIVGGLFLVIIAIPAALAFSIAGSGSVLTSALNDLAWAVVVLSSLPRAMLIMSGSFGLWRAGLISNTLFAAGVAALVLVLLGGSTWFSDGFWSPSGVYSRVVSPVIFFVWIVAVSRVLTRSPASRAGW